MTKLGEKKIGLRAIPAENGEVDFVEVQAKVKGFLGVFKDTDSGSWKIMHGPTGYTVRAYDTQKEAAEVRNRLVNAEIDWEFTDHKQGATRDIAAIVQQIEKEVKEGIEAAATFTVKEVASNKNVYSGGDRLAAIAYAEGQAEETGKQHVVIRGDGKVLHTAEVTEEEVTQGIEEEAKAQEDDLMPNEAYDEMMRLANVAGMVPMDDADDDPEEEEEGEVYVERDDDFDAESWYNADPFPDLPFEDVEDILDDFGPEA